MSDWFFPTRGYGETEGLSNPGLEMFKGEPIRAMAREICQNSLDAAKNSNKPVRVEFEKIFIKPVSKFPGMKDLSEILKKCRLFWMELSDDKTLNFINEAARQLKESGLIVLRISDYNTTGLKGAFSQEKVTPWKSLVQGNSFSVKNTDSAAGSYGIGKAAPFVVSLLQTVFYRTLDENGVKAAQGVTHLVSFEDKEMSFSGEDYIRRSTGYFGEGRENHPFESIKALDDINLRTECGTDLFIPAFNFAAGKMNWEDEVIVEILENFLYSIYAEKLEVKIGNIILKKDTLEREIKRLMPKTKNANSFFSVIRDDNADVIEENKKFYEMGSLRLRLLYKPDMNKQVLIVRNSGMKIAKIPGLPKGIAYTGFLEIQGGKLNAFFRGMENPQHNGWEPNRHNDPVTAKKQKKAVEDWVKEMIGQKIKDISGDELDLDLKEFFSGQEITDLSKQDGKERENILDTSQDIKEIQENVESKKFKVKDIGSESGAGSRMKSGIIDDAGSEFGHRHRSGKRRNYGKPGNSG